VSYQVIARKYRPRRFSEVVGQDHVSQTLAHAIEQNRVAHAYIFCGPRGTGKTTLARIFAKCLNCSNGPRVEFDEADPRCLEIAEGRSLDVLEIDGASNNGVEQIRDLRETCKYAPAMSRFKIYIIDEVHMLTPAAFNALLKTLEEPPAHVKFLFATTDPEKVLPTILSRCQRFDLRRIPVNHISRHLAAIAAKEDVTIDSAAVEALARGAEGAMRDAESALDQLISFCGSNIQEPDVLSMFGLAAGGQIIEISNALLTGQVEPALRQLDTLAAHGKDLGRLLSDLLNHFRNLLVFQVSRGDTSSLEISETEAAALKKQSALAPQSTLTRILEILADSEFRIRDAASRRILLEITFLKVIEARNAMPLDAVLKQLQALRDSGDGSVPRPRSMSAEPVQAADLAAAPRPAPASRQTFSQEPSQHSPPVGDAQIEPAVSAAGNGLSSELASLWSRILDAVGRVSPFARSYLLEAHPVSLNNGLLTIGFDPEFEEHIGLVDHARNHTLLQTKLLELGHPNVQIKFIKAEAPAGWTAAATELTAAAPAPSPEPTKASPASKPIQVATDAPSRRREPNAQHGKDDFKNDPLIKKALELFKGQIVEIRA
jgi:DNA polymerase-3 subunit gamma/tau